MIRLAIIASHPVQYYAPLFRELARKIDVEVFYAHRATPDQQASAGFGTAFDWDVDLLSGYKHRFLTNTSMSPTTQQFNGCNTPEVASIIRREKFDVILVMGWNLRTYIQAIFAAKRARVPVMVRGDSHLGTPRHFIKRLFKSVTYPLLLRAFDAVLYVGERNRQYYEYYHYPDRQMFHVPHCVDTDWFSARATFEAGQALRLSLEIAPDDSIVLFAGKLVPFKRPLDIVGAIARIHKRANIALMIAGAGPLEANLADECRRQGVRLYQLGFCNQTKMPAVYAAAQVLVLPSTGRETWGMVCNEALASGTPIIVSDAVGCTPDLAKSASAGRSYELGNIEQLSLAIAAILHEAPKADAISRISQQYAIRTAITGIERAIKELLK